MGIFGPADIDKLKRRRDTKGLLKAFLSDNVTAYRKSAAEAIVELHSSQTVSELQTIFLKRLTFAHEVYCRDEKEIRRIGELATLLARVGGAEVVPTLAEAMAIAKKLNRLRDVFLAITAALGEMNIPEAAAVLVPSIGDVDQFVRKHAAEALQRLNWKPTSDVERVFFWSALGDWGAFQADLVQNTDVLIHMVQPENSLRDQMIALETIGEIGNRSSDVVSCLLALTASKLLNKADAVAALGKLGITSALARVQEVVEEDLNKLEYNLSNSIDTFMVVHNLKEEIAALADLELLSLFEEKLEPGQSSSRSPRLSRPVSLLARALALSTQLPPAPDLQIEMLGVSTVNALLILDCLDISIIQAIANHPSRRVHEASEKSPEELVTARLKILRRFGQQNR